MPTSFKEHHITDQQLETFCEKWREYATKLAGKLRASGYPFTREDIEDAGSEGMVKALGLKDKPEPYIATSVGNVVRNMGERLRTRSRDVNWDDHEK